VALRAFITGRHRPRIAVCTLADSRVCEFDRCACASVAVTPSKKGGKKKQQPATPAAEIAVSSSPAAPSIAASPVSLFSRLILHPFCSSMSLYELRFLEELDLHWTKHCVVYQWQTDAEQSSRIKQQRAMGRTLIERYAKIIGDDGRRQADARIGGQMANARPESVK
jgi:hypothetical protein